MKIKTKLSMDYSMMVADFLLKDWHGKKAMFTQEDKKYLIELSENFDKLSDIARQLVYK